MTVRPGFKNEATLRAYSCMLQLYLARISLAWEIGCNPIVGESDSRAGLVNKETKRFTITILFTYLIMGSLIGIVFLIVWAWTVK